MLIKKLYYIPTKPPFTQEKQEKILSLFKNTELNVRQIPYTLEISIERANPFLENVKIRQLQPSYIGPQYEITAEGEEKAIKEFLPKIEQILELS